MKYLQIALNVPANQTFTYANVEAGKRVAQEEKAQKDLIPQKRARKVDSFEARVGSRAEVMFGNKRMIGIITDVFDTLPEDLSFDARKIPSSRSLPNSSGSTSLEYAQNRTTGT